MELFRKNKVAQFVNGELIFKKSGYSPWVSRPLFLKSSIYTSRTSSRFVKPLYIRAGVAASLARGPDAGGQNPVYVVVELYIHDTQKGALQNRTDTGG